MSPRLPTNDDLLGVTVVDRYRIISRLGAGGMGTAYRAWDEQAGIPVVIKIPKRTFVEDPKFAERFRREIRLLRGLVHPHIVPIVDDGEHDGLPFVVMRFLPGGSLSNRRLRDDSGRVKPNPPGMLHLWLPAVADALDVIHASGVVHRDVKPANIFFDATWGAFVGDFGIAKILSESDTFDRERTLTATGMGIGTPDYMAPEQFAPKAAVDGRADQYALAVIVHEMLGGTRPFTGESANLIVEVMTQTAPRLKRSGLPPSLVDAVHRGLAKRPGDRFVTCVEFAAAVLRDVEPLDDEPGIVRLLCPKCANLLKLPQSAAGRKGRCPKCKTEMKVAEDLGAMWLLDEARRQDDAASVGTFAFAGGKAVGEEPSLEAFRPVSGTTPIGRAAHKSRHWILEWIDGHGLVLSSVAALAALIPMLLLAVTHAFELTDEEQVTVSRLQNEKEALEKQLEDSNNCVESLQAEVDASRKNVGHLQKELADVRHARKPEPQPAERRPAPASDLPQQIINSIGMKLQLIPAGSFTMGSDEIAANQRPARQVQIPRSFYIGTYEVTNAEWKAVMGSVPSNWKDDDRPVEQVSWHDAAAFCRKLSERQDERNVGRVYRLPTEAEWEYACRAGTTTRFSFGDDDAAFGDYGWCADNSGRDRVNATDLLASDPGTREKKAYEKALFENGCQSHPVGQRKPNPWGLYDMHGNVSEWCDDWQMKTSVGAVASPQTPSPSTYVVTRGGNWLYTIEKCWSAYRGSSVPSSHRWSTLGFRVALSSPGASTPDAQSQPRTVSEYNRPKQSIDNAIAATATAPSDKVADGVVGWYCCFTERNWPRGLPFLPRGDREDVASAARAERWAAGVAMEAGESNSSALGGLGSGRGPPKPGALSHAAEQWWILTARQEIDATEFDGAMRKQTAELLSRGGLYQPQSRP